MCFGRLFEGDTAENDSEGGYSILIMLYIAEGMSKTKVLFDYKGSTTASCEIAERKFIFDPIF